MRNYILAIAALLLGGCDTAGKAQPIIDVHHHAPLASDQDDVTGPASTLAEMAASNVVLSIVSVTSPVQTETWHKAQTDKLMLGAMMPCPQNLAPPMFDCFPDTDGLPDIAWLRQAVQSGKISAFHEMMFNYDGSLPSDPKMTPYWALAAEMNIPVGVHTWSGPPPGQSIRANANCCPEFKGEIGNPKNLRPVLDQFPNLKIWIQHVGSDGDMLPEMWAETLSLLADYPNVYLDLSITNSVLPVTFYDDALAKLIEAGFGDRIMMGSDNLPVSMIVERLNSIETLTNQQRRAILYDNAADFLDLDKETRARHHGK